MLCLVIFTAADPVPPLESRLPTASRLVFKVPEFDTSLTRTPRRDYARSFVVDHPRTSAVIRRIQRASMVQAEQTNYPEDIRP
jgi:hypothetical protein